MRHFLARTSLRLLRPRRLRYFRDLLHSQWNSADKVASMQRDKLAGLLAHAAAQVPFYRKVCQDLGLSSRELALSGQDQALQALAAFPLVDKHIMQSRQSEFLAIDAGPADRIAQHTGGSTGTWFHFFNDRRCSDFVRAVDLRGRTWAGWQIGDKQALLWGHQKDVKGHAGPVNRVRDALVNRTVILDAFNLNEQQVQDFHRILTSFRPALLLGYSSALAFFASYLTRQRLSLPAIKGIMSSAETLDAERRQVIQDAFGRPVINRYGSREFGTIAQQCERIAGMHVSSERLLLEVLDPQGRPCAVGQRGEMVITDLDNRAMPFIRYRTGDLAVPTAEACPCGRGLPVLAEVEGRITDLLVGKNGRMISCPGPTFFTAGIPGVRQLQIIQDHIDHLELRVVPDEHWTDQSPERLTRRMQELLGEVEVTITLVPDIPVTTSGKYRFAISSVSPFGKR